MYGETSAISYNFSVIPHEASQQALLVDPIAVSSGYNFSVDSPSSSLVHWIFHRYFPFYGKLMTVINATAS